VTNPGFENGLTGWTSVFGGTVGASTSPVHDGDTAGRLSGRGDWYHGLGTDLTGKLASGTTYRASAWVRLGSSTNENAYLTVRVMDNSGTHYYTVVTARASATEWTRIAGDFTPVFTGAATSVVLYAEGPAGGIDLLVDDLSVVPRDPNLLVPQGALWHYRDNGVFPGANWTAVNYDDSAWTNGPAQLGYGDGDEARTINYGFSATNRFITTWFRTTFNLANPQLWQYLHLRLLRDDGAVAYLNGVEIFRSNLPDGPISANTTALSAVGGLDEARFFTTNVNPALLRAGDNVVAVEVHQNTNTSSDISFDLELAGIGPQPVTVSGARALWRYSDIGANLGTAWRMPTFNDAFWKSGLAQLGYGDGEEGTVISYGAVATNKYPTTYFRRAVVLDPAAYAQFVLRLQRDDGAVVYVNGTEVFRSNLPEGPISYSTLATNAVDDGNTWLTAPVPRSLMQSGTNVIAVEVHQTTLNSSDLSFDLELLGYPGTTLPTVAAVTATGQREISWPMWASGYSVYATTNLASPWVRLTDSVTATNGTWRMSLPQGAGTGFYRLGNP
jgi:hypothetical protein